jgi:hypothetical protein
MRLPKVIILGLLLGFTNSAVAATISFDDMPVTRSFLSLDTPQGYSFFTIGPLDVRQRSGTTDNYLNIENTLGYPALMNTDGNLFSLQQLDVYFFDEEIWGYGFTSHDVVITALDSQTCVV